MSGRSLVMTEVLCESDASALAQLAVMLENPLCFAARALLLSTAHRPPMWSPRAQMLVLPDGHSEVVVPSHVLAACERGPAYTED